MRDVDVDLGYPMQKIKLNKIKMSKQTLAIRKYP